MAGGTRTARTLAIALVVAACASIPLISGASSAAAAGPITVIVPDPTGTFGQLYGQVDLSSATVTGGACYTGAGGGAAYAGDWYGQAGAGGVSNGHSATCPYQQAQTPQLTTSGGSAGGSGYGEGSQLNVPVTATGGTVLRADVYYPTDPATGTEAEGPFPVILIQTPYGKTAGAYIPPSEGLGPDANIIEHGYIEVVADIRGTGDSGGTFNLLDPVQATDGVSLVHWAAQLPHSDGNVGALGPSYLGFVQLMTAAKIGPGSPLKAIFPIVAGNDVYRDAAFQGGILDGEFDAAYEALMVGVTTGNPVAEDYNDPLNLAKVEQDHAGNALAWQVPQTENIATGGDEAYDQDYWQARAVRNMIPDIVANGIPAFLVGGWHDLFQRGELTNYAEFQNAYDGLPLGAPMSPGQPVTGRYQLLMGPWYHLTYGQGINLEAIELAWFDHWLKGVPNGIDQTSTPLHLDEMGANQYVDTADYPLAEATPTRYYLASGGTLSTTAPANGGGADTIVYTGASSPCRGSTEQWGAGAGQLASSVANGNEPCGQNDMTSQAGPGSLTYTTAPLSSPETIAGPIDVTLYATSTTSDAEWDATIDDVASNSASTPVTSGALLGSFRALDDANTWFAGDGAPVAPFHPYTQVSAQPVVPGQVTRYDIEVFPSLDEIPAGDSLRLTLTTSDTPHLLPTPGQAKNLAGGVYSVEHSSDGASFVEIPLATPSSFSTGCRLCG
jgi:putative CocE/NonD family hydrolase